MVAFTLGFLLLLAYPNFRILENFFRILGIFSEFSEFSRYRKQRATWGIPQQKICGIFLRSVFFFFFGFRNFENSEIGFFFSQSSKT